MKIGVISDSHGNINALKTALDKLNGIDQLIHAGDILYHPPRLQDSPDYNFMESAIFLNSLKIPINVCQGNCDSQVYTEILDFYEEKPTVLCCFGKYKAIVNHGHMLNEIAMISLAKDCNAQIFVSGHTHVPNLYKKDGIILLNPGSISIPRFPNPPDPTAGIIDGKNIKIFGIKSNKIYFEMDIE